MYRRNRRPGSGSTPNGHPVLRAVLNESGTRNQEHAGPLAQRTAKNALFSFLGFVYPTILTIVVTPVIVRGLGAESYGILALSSVLVGFVALLDLGAAPSLLKFVSEYRARDDFEGVNEVLGASIVFYLVVGLIGGLATFVVGWFFLPEVFNLSPEAVPLAQFAFSAAAITFVISMPANPLGAFAASLQRWDISAAVGIGWTTVAAITGVVVVSLGYGLRVFVVANALVVPIAIASMIAINRRLLPEFRPIFRVNRTLLKKIFSFSGFIFVGNVSGFVLFELDKVLIGSLASVALVTYYVIPGALARRLHSASASLATVLLPVASDLLARGEHRRVEAMYRRAVTLVTLFVVTFGIPATIYSQKIMLYWLGSDFAAKSSDVLRLLIATYAVLSLSAVPYYVAVGAGRPVVTAMSSLGAALLNVGLILFLIPRFGLIGAAVAYLLSTAPVIGFIWYTEKRILGLRRGPWIPLMAKLLIPVTAQVVVGAFALSLVTNLLTLLLVLSAVILILPLTFYLCGFVDPDDRELFLRLLAGRRHAVAGGTTT
jgi:O-antigen/teichoic acid export membrane protein